MDNCLLYIVILRTIQIIVFMLCIKVLDCKEIFDNLKLRATAIKQIPLKIWNMHRDRCGTSRECGREASV